jgi:hypothetical protein
MNDTLVTPAKSSRPDDLRVTQTRVVMSEWTKFRSLRSTVCTLLTAVVAMIGIGALVAAITANQPGGLEPGQSAIFTSLTGTFIAQLAMPMLWGTLAVLTAALFLTMLIASFAAFFVGQALLRGQQLDASLSDPGALQAVIGAALYETVAGITALALGALLRNTAAAITTFVAVFFVIPPLTLLLPTSLTDHFVQYLPSNLGGELLGGT